MKEINIINGFLYLLAKLEIMFVVFGFMAAGVLTGWLLRRHRAGWTGKVTMALIWLLLLILGVEVGSDRRIVESGCDCGGLAARKLSGGPAAVDGCAAQGEHF